MKWYKFQTYVLWPSSLIIYALTYLMFDGIDFSDAPFDTIYLDEIVGYLIPLHILHSLLLIYLFHKKSHLSLKFFIMSSITLTTVSYLFFGIPVDIFYLIPYLVFNFIYYNKRKEIFTG